MIPISSPHELHHRQGQLLGQATVESHSTRCAPINAAVETDGGRVKPYQHSGLLEAPRVCFRGTPHRPAPGAGDVPASHVAFHPLHDTNGSPTECWSLRLVGRCRNRQDPCPARNTAIMPRGRSTQHRMINNTLIHTRGKVLCRGAAVCLGPSQTATLTLHSWVFGDNDGLMVVAAKSVNDLPCGLPSIAPLPCASQP
jgi:hypothetical protein